MSSMAVLVVTVLTAAGDPAFPPYVNTEPDLATCQASAKAFVEALALAHEEKAMPARLAKTEMRAEADASGVFVIHYKRQLRTDPTQGEDATARMIRGVCREVSG
jgi:hypothetical protein